MGQKNWTTANKISRCINRFFSAIMIGTIKVYRAVLSPFFGGHCRFTPTCSIYAIDSIRKYGPWKGARMAIKRILRCNPFFAGGHDEPNDDD